eukprot:765728-Hanusia_phi.AAC.2
MICHDLHALTAFTLSSWLLISLREISLLSNGVKQSCSAILCISSNPILRASYPDQGGKIRQDMGSFQTSISIGLPGRCKNKKNFVGSRSWSSNLPGDKLA